MEEHMINWFKVAKDNARLTPKGISDVYIYIGIPNDCVLVIKGDRSQFPLPASFYPAKLIPVYGF